MSHSKPPADIDSGRLFLLLAGPRPLWPVHYAGVRMAVRPLSTLEWETAICAGDKLCAIISAALCQPSGAPVFRDAEHCAELLTEDDALDLGRVVTDELQRVSPIKALIDRPRWSLYLRRGAAQHGSIAVAMADTCDVVLGAKAHSIPRPDRWFGGPVCQLADGQLMAYDAAVDVCQK